MYKVPERLNSSISGLKNMIAYLESKYDIKNMTIVEIGSWTGISAVEFAKKFKEVICIDPWSPTVGINTMFDMSEVEKIFDNRVKGLDNVKKIKGKSVDIAKRYIRNGIKFNFIYVDGAHDYTNVKMDIEAWRDNIMTCICGHDYYNKFPGVIKAVNETLGKPDKTFKDTSWIKEI
jgi:hypothetical protein